MDKPKSGWEFFCAHPNEVPRVCPCPPTCGCRFYHCKKQSDEKTEPTLTDIDRDDILRKAYQYLQHPDEFVKILAQITIYHYGDK